MDVESQDNFLNGTLYIIDRMPHSVSVIFVAMKIYVFLIGLIGNIIACFVMAYSKDLHTTIHFYLFNLSTSDIVYLIMEIASYLYEYYHNKYRISSKTVCELTIWLSETSVYVSILTITTLTIERYLAICHPFLVRSMSQKSRVTKIIVLIWIVSAICASALTFPPGDALNSEIVPCVAGQMPYSIEVLTILFFVLPMVAIFIMYSLITKQLIARKRVNCQVGNSTRKTLIMLALIIIAFFICWAPFHFARIISVHIADADSSNLEFYDMIFQYSSSIAQISCLLSTAVNPIIYTFSSENFRKASKVSLLNCSKSRPDTTISRCNQEQEMRTIASISERM